MQKKTLSEKLEKYIKAYYIEPADVSKTYSRFSFSCPAYDAESVSNAVQKYVESVAEPETFSDQVNRYLRDKDLSAVEVYQSLGMGGD